MIIKNFKSKLSIVSLFLLFTFHSYCLKLPKLVGNSMILQRDMLLPIWGWADPGEKVSVSFNNKFVETTSNSQGKWIIRFSAMPAGGPFQMIVKGKTETITLENIMLGDVWVCSGQSNMEWKMSWLGETYKEEMNQANYPDVRFIDVANVIDFKPRADVETEGWRQVNSTSIPNVSAVGYFFAKNLHEQYKVPIGLILSEWGGTPAESWTSAEALKTMPEYAPVVEELSRNTKTEEELDKEYQAEIKKWEAAFRAKDLGFSSGLKWYTNDLDIKSWKSMEIPQMWEKLLPDYDGIVWFRKEITLPQELAGKDLTLNLSVIDDEDTTYFNGIKVGSTQGHNKERKYVVPGKLVKPGKNTITVRVVDTGGGGGLWGNKDALFIEANGKKVNLAGLWKYKESVDFASLPQKPVSKRSPWTPTSLYNGMIAPLIPYAIKGAIWYQGESNTGRAHQYQTLFPLMINDWRNKWGQGEFPFLYVQLANFMAPKAEPSESQWAELREAQFKTLTKVPKTGMAVIIDIGEAQDIHPKNKHDVGKRLFYLAQQVAYNDKSNAYGPMYKNMATEGDKIRLTFDHAGTGFEVKGGELREFTIAGIDKKFYRAKAVIDGNSIVVSNEKVKAPVAVRYAWADNPDGANLYDKEGIPATPFRTDDWPGLTTGKK